MSDLIRRLLENGNPDENLTELELFTEEEFSFFKEVGILINDS
jgi:hypothetical protein